MGGMRRIQTGSDSNRPCGDSDRRLEISVSRSPGLAAAAGGSAAWVYAMRRRWCKIRRCGRQGNRQVAPGSNSLDRALAVFVFGAKPVFEGSAMLVTARFPIL